MDENDPLIIEQTPAEPFTLEHLRQIVVDVKADTISPEGLRRFVQSIADLDGRAVTGLQLTMLVAQAKGILRYQDEAAAVAEKIANDEISQEMRLVRKAVFGIDLAKDNATRPRPEHDPHRMPKGKPWAT